MGGGWNNDISTMTSEWHDVVNGRQCFLPDLPSATTGHTQVYGKYS